MRKSWYDILTQLFQQFCDVCYSACDNMCHKPWYNTKTSFVNIMDIFKYDMVNGRHISRETKLVLFSVLSVFQYIKILLGMTQCVSSHIFSATFWAQWVHTCQHGPWRVQIILHILPWFRQIYSLMATTLSNWIFIYCCFGETQGRLISKCHHASIKKLHGGHNRVVRTSNIHNGMSCTAKTCVDIETKLGLLHVLLCLLNFILRYWHAFTLVYMMLARVGNTHLVWYD